MKILDFHLQYMPYIVDLNKLILKCIGLKWPSLDKILIIIKAYSGHMAI